MNFKVQVIDKIVTDQIEQVVSVKWLHESDDTKIQDFLKKHHGKRQLKCGCRGFHYKYDTRLSIKRLNDTYYWACISSPQQHVEDCPFRKNVSVLPSKRRENGLEIYNVSTTRKRTVESKDTDIEKGTSKESKTPDNDRTKARKKGHKNLFGVMSHINMDNWKLYSESNKYNEMPFSSYLMGRFKSISLSKLKINGSNISINDAMFKYKKFFYGTIENVNLNGNYSVSIKTSSGFIFRVLKKDYENAMDRYGFVNNDIYNVSGYTLCGYLEEYEKRVKGKKIKGHNLGEFVILRTNKHGLFVESNFEGQVAEGLYNEGFSFYKALTPIDAYNHWTPDFMVKNVYADIKKEIIVEVFGMKDFSYMLQKESKLDYGQKLNSNNYYYLFNAIDHINQWDGFIDNMKVLLNRTKK